MVNLPIDKMRRGEDIDLGYFCWNFSVNIFHSSKRATIKCEFHFAIFRRQCDTCLLEYYTGDKVLKYVCILPRLTQR